MRITRIFLACATILVIIPVPLQAVELSVDSIMQTSAGIEVQFSRNEIRIIREHYASGSHRGKSSKGPRGLPPGIAKNLARGKPLPPGIAKRALPSDLRRALPPVRDGYERIIVGGKILLVEVATQVIHDVLSDVILNR